MDVSDEKYREGSYLSGHISLLVDLSVKIKKSVEFGIEGTLLSWSVEGELLSSLHLSDAFFSEEDVTHFLATGDSLLVGEPVAGDPTYGGGNKRAFNEASTKQIRQIVSQLNRQALHALRLGFIHPRTGQFIQFSSSIPLDLAPIFGLFPPLSGNGLQSSLAKESSINIDDF